MHYYQHHIGDFIKDTANLDDHQLATYMRMIWSYYSSEKPITGELEDVAFAMRSDEKTVRLLLRHFFVESPDGWVHNRCEREIAEYRSKGEKARNSAKARWSNANGMRTHSERNANATVLDANQEPITNNQEPVNTNTGASAKRGKPAVVKPDGVSDSVWADFLAIRKAKRAPLTATALDGIEREATKAGMNLADVLALCCTRGWQGFKAEWVEAKAKPTVAMPQAMSFAERDELAKRKRWEEMTGRTWPTDGSVVIDVTPRTLEI